MKRRWTWRIACLVAPAFLIGACGLFDTKAPPPPCPPIFLLKDTETLTRHKPASSGDITDVLFQGSIIDFQGVCEYNKERTRVEIALNIAFEILRGPANADRKAAFGYFVAIPRFHPAPEGKRTFPLTAEFAGNTTRVRLNDEINLEIPIDRKVSREKYAIYVGFDLTPDELKENRRARKF